MYVVVSGPPGSGKTTLAGSLAAELALPLLAKDVDRSVVESRHAARASTREHCFDHQRTAEELWNDEVAEPVAGGWPVLEVDTSGPVDVKALAQRERHAAGSAA